MEAEVHQACVPLMTNRCTLTEIEQNFATELQSLSDTIANRVG